MTDDRFNQLVNTVILDHPLMPFRFTRLMLALRYVVELTGPAGDEALESYCRQRRQLDAENERR